MKLEKILFLDIETAPQVGNLDEMPAELAYLWTEKVEQLRKRIPERYAAENAAEANFQEAGIFAEFGRIVCISVGYMYYKGAERFFRVKSFSGENEIDANLSSGVYLVTLQSENGVKTQKLIVR